MKRILIVAAVAAWVAGIGLTACNTNKTAEETSSNGNGICGLDHKTYISILKMQTAELPILPTKPQMKHGKGRL